MLRAIAKFWMRRSNALIRAAPGPESSEMLRNTEMSVLINKYSVSIPDVMKRFFARTSLNTWRPRAYGPSCSAHFALIAFQNWRKSPTMEPAQCFQSSAAINVEQ